MIGNDEYNGKSFYLGGDRFIQINVTIESWMLYKANLSTNAALNINEDESH